VAKGYIQEYDLDYDETFSSLVKVKTIQIILSLATIFNWFIEQLDAKTAFLHGNLNEEVYMEQPMGYSERDSVHKICRLKKGYIWAETGFTVLV
jgi:hypothetical protein